MKNFAQKLELFFEKFVNVSLRVYGSPFTFLIAVIMVVAYVSTPGFYRQSTHDILRDIFLCISFISFFIIQKAFNKYSAALHLKINELVSAHEKASNELVNVEQKTEEELKELAKNYEAKKHESQDAGKKAAQE
ncbi:MAG: low affinity iron permease family protein [Chitinophagaceae bacterium]|nr:low affinity iron permease family protein [Chitinophagaceae bacterium]